jgi:ATP-dependent DNA helicase RecG
VSFQQIAYLSKELKELVGGKTAKALERSFGIVTVGDLLNHYPRRYAERGELTSFQQIEVGKPVTIMASIAAVTSRRMHSKRGSLLLVTVTDGTDFMELTFFNQKWREKELVVGSTGLFAGTVSDYHGKLNLTHPQYQLFVGELDSHLDAIKSFAGSLIPVYPSSQAITSWQISAAMNIVLASLENLPDPIPSSIRKAHGLMDRTEAIRVIHQPETRDAIERAQYRIKYEEAFILQALLEQRRIERKGMSAVARRSPQHSLRNTFDESLPFNLTVGQVAVGEEIDRDLASDTPMMRLLQGDVGSGKTVVALRAMLDVVESGGQAALLVPTEVLASQHWESLVSLLGDLYMTSEVHVTLLTGSMSAASRQRALLDIASGLSQIVVGTHALFQEGVDFFDLGLVVVDEQHRFGVEQRAALVAKGRQGTRPHMLVMTATPIPRTTALTTFGDLDISTLGESPAMRAEVQTFVVNANVQPHHEARVWERMVEEVKKGNRVFIVCPSISANDPESKPKGVPAPIASVEETLSELTTRYPDIAFAELHGQMSADEKRDVMRRFRSESDTPVQVVVATTVIEVGVDVPNATMMIILNAERFGISQLHQLRGRIGRGDRPGLCILLQGSQGSETSLERLEAVRSTRDGFKLAQLDMEIRGEGDVLGSDQSGVASSLRMLKVIEDSVLIDSVRKEVIELSLSDEWTSIISAIDFTDILRATQLEKT